MFERLAVLIAVLTALNAPVMAQSFTASLQGLIRDTSGAAVPAAGVTLENEATNVRQTTSSDERGRYFFTAIPPGTYRLMVEVTGFKKATRSGMVLQVQQQASVDMTIEPGELTTTITVTGEAPPPGFRQCDAGPRG